MSYWKIVLKTIAKYGNCFENNRPVTINSMFNECSAAHLPFNALQVIRMHGAATPTTFNSNYRFTSLQPYQDFSTPHHWTFRGLEISELLIRMKVSKMLLIL